MNPRLVGSGFCPAESLTCRQTIIEYKEAGCLTVLDPFVLNHNVTGNVNEKTKCKFVNELKRAAEISHDWPECQPGVKPWGLAALMVPGETPKPPSKPGGENSGGSSKVKAKGKGHAAAIEGGKPSTARVEGEQENGDFYVALQPQATTLTCEGLVLLAQQNNVTPMVQWCNSAQEMVLNVLQSVFNIEITEEERSELGTSEYSQEALDEQGSGRVVSEQGCLSPELNPEGAEKEPRGCFSIDISTMSKDDMEVTSGKRTSDAARLDSSSSESSLEALSSGDNINLSAKDTNPKKKLCEGVGIGSFDKLTEVVTSCHAIGSNVNETIASKSESGHAINRRVEQPSTCNKEKVMPRGISNEDNSAPTDHIIEGSSEFSDSRQEIEREEGKESAAMVIASSEQGQGSSGLFDSAVAESAKAETLPLSDEKALPLPDNKTKPLSTASTRVFRTSSYSCYCRHQLWLGRKILRAKVASAQQLTDLALEQEITRLALKEMEKVLEKSKEGECKGQSPNDLPKIQDEGKGQNRTDQEGRQGNFVSPQLNSKCGIINQEMKRQMAENMKGHQKGEKGSKKQNDERAKTVVDCAIAFTCQIFHQSNANSGLSYILVKMRPSDASYGGFKNLFCSFRAMILRLVQSNLFNR